MVFHFWVSKTKYYKSDQNITDFLPLIEKLLSNPTNKLSDQISQFFKQFDTNDLSNAILLTLNSDSITKDDYQHNDRYYLWLIKGEVAFVITSSNVNYLVDQDWKVHFTNKQ